VEFRFESGIGREEDDDDKIFFRKFGIFHFFTITGWMSVGTHYQACCHLLAIKQDV
jgi:hypothetical protein